VIHYHGHQPILANYIPRSVNFVQTRHDQGSDCLIYTRFHNGEVCRATDPRACAACATPRPNLLQGALSAWSVRLWRRAVANAFRRHKVIFVSQFLRANAVRTLGVLSETTARIVPHFLDISVMAAALSDDVATATASDILIVGRIDQAKGVGTLLETLDPGSRLKARITVAGDGPQLAELRQRHEADGVRFLGWTPYKDVVRLAAGARLVVVPSLWEEAFGGTTLEALLLGRPVLALRRGATPELDAYARFPRQLRLFDSMAELVAALSDSAASVPALQGLGFAGDVRAHLGEIESIYRQEALH